MSSFHNIYISSQYRFPVHPNVVPDRCNAYIQEYRANVERGCLLPWELRPRWVAIAAGIIKHIRSAVTIVRHVAGSARFLAWQFSRLTQPLEVVGHSLRAEMPACVALAVSCYDWHRTPTFSWPLSESEQAWPLASFLPDHHRQQASTRH